MPFVDLGRVRPVVRGAWGSGTAYDILDIVSHGGGSYVSVQPVPAGTALTDTAYWLQLAAKGDPGTAAWADLTGTPTTLAGYGITDAATSAQGTLAATALQPGALIPWTDVTGKPTFFSGAYGDLTGIPSTFTPSAHTQAWATITATPTTLAGYGITDAATAAQGTLAASALQPGASIPWADVSGKPTFATVATSGAYSDLTGLPALFSGAYGDLTGIPSTFTPSAHTQAASTISDFAEAVDDRVAGLLVAGSGITTTYDDVANTLTLSTSGGSDFTLCTLLKPAATAWITNAWNNTAFTVQAQAAGRAVLSPFLSSHDVTIDQVGVSVSTAVAGALFKVVIYAADADGRPTTVLAESGTLDAASAVTRTIALGSSVTLTRGTLYWIGIRSSSTAALRCLNVGASPQLTASTAATPVGTITIIRTGEVFADPASAWTFANSQLSNALAPLVLMRVA